MRALSYYIYIIIINVEHKNNRGKKTPANPQKAYTSIRLLRLTISGPQCEGAKCEVRSKLPEV